MGNFNYSDNEIIPRTIIANAEYCIFVKYSLYTILAYIVEISGEAEVIGATILAFETVTPNAYPKVPIVTKNPAKNTYFRPILSDLKFKRPLYVANIIAKKNIPTCIIRPVAIGPISFTITFSKIKYVAHINDVNKACGMPAESFLPKSENLNEISITPSTINATDPICKNESTSPKKNTENNTTHKPAVLATGTTIPNLPILIAL